MSNEDNTAIILQTIQSAFREVAPWLLETAGDVTYSNKLDGSPLTELDIAVEKKIINDIKSTYPSIRIYGEESGYDQEVLKGECWIIDPIDGTKSFINNTGNFTNMALQLIDGVANACVIYNPTTDNMYHAVKNQGAYKNNLLLDLQSTQDKKLVFCKPNYQEKLQEILDPYSITCTPSPIGAGHYFTMLAEGHVSGNICLLGKGYLHDYATGALLFKEAGGILMPIHDIEYSVNCKSFIACHPDLSIAFRQTLTEIRNFENQLQ